MSYNRLEINLLPPELQPGPAVRYSLLINVVIISVTVAFIAVDSFIGLTRMANLGRDNHALEDDIARLQPVVADYMRLRNIDTQISSYGQLISLASGEYVDIPVVLERLAQIIPEGVFVETISNERPSGPMRDVVLAVELRSAERDPALVVDTFLAFKEDPLLGNCYLRLMEYEEDVLEPYLKQFNINWQADGPELPQSLSSNQYKFEIRALLPVPMSTDAEILVDDFVYLQKANLTPEPKPEPVASEELGVVGAPPGVTVEGTN